MIAVLFTEDYESINYHIDSGIWASIMGSIAIFIVYKLDNLINSVVVKSLKSVFLINFFISFIITTLLFFITSWILNIILRGSFSVNFSFLKEQIIIIYYLLILILAYHTISFFTRTMALKNKKLIADNKEMSLALNKYLKRIPSVLNKKTSLIPIDDILYFKIDDGIIFAYLSDDNKKALTIATLNVLESKLNPNVFFRINRSEIVNINKISSFEPYFKDRLAVKLIGNKTILYTSNAKSASFRNWLIDSAN